MTDQLVVVVDDRYMEKRASAILADGALGTLEGKTGNGLVMYSRRSRVVTVIDSTRAGRSSI